mgnify:FL=1
MSGRGSKHLIEKLTDQTNPGGPRYYPHLVSKKFGHDPRDAVSVISQIDAERLFGPLPTQPMELYKYIRYQDSACRGAGVYAVADKFMEKHDINRDAVCIAFGHNPWLLRRVSESMSKQAFDLNLRQK